MRLRWPWRKDERSSPTAGVAQEKPAAVPAPRSEWRNVAPTGGLSGPPELTADPVFGQRLSSHQGLPPVLDRVESARYLTPMAQRMIPRGRSAAVPHGNLDGRTDWPLWRQRSARSTTADDVSVQGPGLPHEASATRRIKAAVHSPRPTSVPEKPTAQLEPSPLPGVSVPNHVAATATAPHRTGLPEPGQSHRSMTVVPLPQRSGLDEGAPPPGRIELDRRPSTLAPGSEEPAEGPTTESGSATTAAPRPGPASPTAVQASTSGGSLAPAPGLARRSVPTQRSPSGRPRRTVRSAPRSTRTLGLGEPFAGSPPSRVTSRPATRTPEEPETAPQRATAASPSSPDSQGATPASSSASKTEAAPAAKQPAEEPPRAEAAALTLATSRATTALEPAAPALATSNAATALEPAAPAHPARPVPLPTAMRTGAPVGPAKTVPAGPTTRVRPRAGAQRSVRRTAEAIYQRAPRERPAVSTPEPEQRAPSAPTGRVRIDRSTEAANAAAGLEANAFTSGDTIVLPQHHGPLDRQRGQALLAHELVHVGQQRRLGASRPAEHTSSGQQLEREAQSAESLVNQLARRASFGDMPVAGAARRQAPTGVSTAVDSEVRQATELALAVGASGAAGSDSFELPTTPPGEKTPGPQRAAAADTPNTTPGTVSSSGPAIPEDDQDLEELARRLYERLRHRLRRELLLDRERSGFLADSR